jgi:hypothetical protein
MDSPKRGGPKEAILKLLSEELRQLICALPKDLQESVPEQLLEETGLAREEDETPKGNG